MKQCVLCFCVTHSSDGIRVINVADVVVGQAAADAHRGAIKTRLLCNYPNHFPQTINNHSKFL